MNGEIAGSTAVARAQAEAVAVATKNRQPSLPPQAQSALPSNTGVPAQPTVASKPQSMMPQQMVPKQQNVAAQNIGKSPQNAGSLSQTSPHMSPQTLTPHHSPVSLSNKAASKPPVQNSKNIQPSGGQTPPKVNTPFLWGFFCVFLSS